MKRAVLTGLLISAVAGGCGEVPTPKTTVVGQVSERSQGRFASLLPKHGVLVWSGPRVRLEPCSRFRVGGGLPQGPGGWQPAGRQPLWHFHQRVHLRLRRLSRRHQPALRTQQGGDTMMTTRVSNAAPYLRERFIDKIRNAHAARTQRDRQAPSPKATASAAGCRRSGPARSVRTASHQWKWSK